MPQLARRADKYALVRGISHNLAAHGLGTRYVMTGNRPTPVVNYPLYGSVVSKEFPASADMPSFVSIDRPVEGPGYLGPEYGPLSTGEKPRYGHPFRVRGVTLGDGLTIEKYRSRRKLRADIDQTFDGFEQLDDSVRGLDRFSEQAFQIISSPRARAAFDLSQETDREVDRFGRHDFGQSMMLTTRLVEAGVGTHIKTISTHWGESYCLDLTSVFRRPSIDSAKRGCWIRRRSWSQASLDVLLR
jgi:hypothetical protein